MAEARLVVAHLAVATCLAALVDHPKAVAHRAAETRLVAVALEDFSRSTVLHVLAQWTNATITSPTILKCALCARSAELHLIYTGEDDFDSLRLLYFCSGAGRGYPPAACCYRSSMEEKVRPSIHEIDRSKAVYLSTQPSILIRIPVHAQCVHVGYVTFLEHGGLVLMMC